MGEHIHDVCIRSTTVDRHGSNAGRTTTTTTTIQLIPMTSTTSTTTTTPRNACISTGRILLQLICTASTFSSTIY